MLRLEPIDDPVSLAALATRVRQSSNFRFNWRFFNFHNADGKSCDDVRRMLALIVDNAPFHAFLRDSFDAMYEDTFSMEPPHEHGTVEQIKVRFDDTLACAAFGHLGAYADHKHSTGAELRFVHDTFKALGHYCSFQWMPGTVVDCAICNQHNHHLFTNWFFGVAWDWCFLVTWPSRQILWMGCLTDTD